MFDIPKLREYVEKSGFKQKAIAQKCGMSEAALSMILNGKRKCVVDEAIRICKAINVDVKEFLH